jgi:hypothetical protein
METPVQGPEMFDIRAYQSMATSVALSQRIQVHIAEAVLADGCLHSVHGPRLGLNLRLDLSPMKAI